jgi:ribosomal protein S18 acetylase RimI-like enzyme
VIRLLVDPEDARQFLNRDRPLCAWPLCFLGPADWPHVRLWADETTGAGLWLFDHPWWGGSVQVIGGPAPLEPMFGGTRLPGRAFVRMLPATRPLVNTRYRFEWVEPIVRMAVTPDRLVVPSEARRAEWLGLDDAPALTTLYAHWPEARFRQGRLRQGYRYVGIRAGDRLVAVAEHVLASHEDGLAIVQGVLVDPDWRGRGLAKAVTAAITERLFAEGFRDVVLDVRASNLAAQAAYERIGYRRHVTLLAGPGSRR